MEETHDNNGDSFESYLEGLRSLILVYDTEPDIDTKSKVSDACKALIELLPSNSGSVQIIILETLLKIENENFATFKKLFIDNKITLVLVDLIINNESSSIQELSFQIIKNASRKLGESDQSFNSILTENLPVFLKLLRNYRINDRDSKSSVASLEYHLLQLVVLISFKQYSYELFKQKNVLEIVIPYLSIKSYAVNQKVCEFLINMSYKGESEVIDEFINLNFLPDLINILQIEVIDDNQESTVISNLQLCVLYVFANITRGSVVQNQRILGFGLLKVLSKFLIVRSTFNYSTTTKTNNSVITTKIIESSSVIISNLSRDPDTSDMIVKQNILPYICRILESDSSPIKVKMKLIFFFSNLVKAPEHRALVANYKIISSIEPVLNLFESQKAKLDLEDIVDTYSNILDICLYVVISNKYQKQFFFKKNVLNGLFPIFSLPTHPGKFSPEKIFLLKKNFIKFLLLLSKNVKEFNYQMLNGTLIIEKLVTVLTNLVKHHKFKNTEDDHSIENSISTITSGSSSLTELSSSSNVLNSSLRNHGYNNIDNDRSATTTPDITTTSKFASPSVVSTSSFSSGMIVVDQSSNTSSETDIFDMLTIIYSVVLNCKTEREQKEIIVSKVDLFKILLEFIDVRYSFKIKYITCELLTILLKIDKELTNINGHKYQHSSPLIKEDNEHNDEQKYVSFFEIIDKMHITKIVYFFNSDDNGAEIDHQIISIISYLFAKYNVDTFNTNNNNNERLFEWFSILLGRAVMNSPNKFLHKLLMIMGKKINISKSSNYPIINNVNIIFNSLFSLKSQRLMDLISKEQISSIIDFFKNLIALLTSRLSKSETHSSMMNTPISGSGSSIFESIDVTSSNSNFESTDSLVDSDSVNISSLSISQGTSSLSSNSINNNNNSGTSIKDSMIIKTIELSIRTLEKFSMVSNKEKQILVGSNILGILAVFAFSLKELFGSMRSQKRLAQNLKLMSIITRLFCEIANGSDSQRLALCSKYNILPFAVTTLTIPNSILTEGNEIVVLKTNVVTLLENLSATYLDKITDMISKMGLIQCLVEFLGEKGYNTVFRLHVVNALSNLASSNNEYLKDIQIDLGVFTLLFKILDQLIKKSDTINECHHNNNNKHNNSLTHSVSYYESLDANGNETVISTLLICSILNLLTNLSNTNSKNTLQIINTGFLPLLFELVSSLDLYVLEKTCKVIRNISNGGVSHSKAIINNYLIIPLNTLFESNHGNEAERKLVEKKLLQYRYISNEEISKLRKTMDVHIVWIFANVSRFEDTQRLTTLNSGVLNTLPQVMTLNDIASKEDKSLQKAIISLLHNLIYSKECLTIIIYDYSELIGSIIRLLLTYNKNEKEENELIVLLLNFMLLVSQVEDMKYRRFLVEQNLLGVVNKFKDSDAMVVKTLTSEIGSNLGGIDIPKKKNTSVY